MGLAQPFAPGTASSARCCSSGMPARSADCTAHATSRTSRTVPLDHIVAQLNIDMIGQSRRQVERSQHRVSRGFRIASAPNSTTSIARRSCARAAADSTRMNDSGAIRNRFTSAATTTATPPKGIPIIFTTGLHPTITPTRDEVSKIEFPKLTRVAQLVYETAWRLGNLDHAPVRDFKGTASGEDLHASDTSAGHHLSHDLRQPGRLRHHRSTAAVLRGETFGARF